MTRSWPLLGVLVFVLSACASTGEGQRTRTDANVLTYEDIQSATARSVYELIERERPRWLQPRVARRLTSNTQVHVYLNDAPLGDVGVLRQLPLDNVRRIQYLDPSQARTRLPSAGVDLTAGVIQILTATGVH